MKESMQITRFRIPQDSCDDEWDAFVDTHPEGRYCNLTSYHRAIAKTYRLSVCRIAFYGDDAAIRGVFSGVLINDFLSRKRIVSMPFTDYGGILLDNDFEISREVLTTAFEQLLHSLNASYLEVKGEACRGGKVDAGVFTVVQSGRYATLPVANPDKLLDGFDSSIRKNLKRAAQNNLRCYNDMSATSIKAAFYPLYLKKMKQFGTPPHSIDFFLNLSKEMGDRLNLFTVSNDGTIVSMLLGIATRNVLQLSNIVSHKDIHRIRHDDFNHWETIQWAYRNNRTILDFGVARYSGQTEYKAKWGAELKAYYYFFYPASRSRTGRHLHDRRSFLNVIWGKFVPLFLAQIIGPAIRKRLGR
jgi:predicted N-acyltransferase